MIGSSGRSAPLGSIDRVEVGIRPQAVRLAAPGAGTLAGKVLLREPLGLEDEFLVQVADAQVKVVAASSHGATEGAEVGLAFDPGAVHLFHAETGETLCCGLDGDDQGGG